MERFFNINYVFEVPQVLARIDEQLNSCTSGYICVADGNILTRVNNDEAYREVVNGAMFSICDSSWVPLYLRSIYGIKRSQYCGSQIFGDIVGLKKYKMAFLGTNQETLDSLKGNVSKIDAGISQMLFWELPFATVDEFDYKAIANKLNDYGADIIWIALGAPKQEIFMSRLNPYLNRGVQIGVGAVFKFFSSVEEKRAPKWMIKSHTEFIYRIMKDPKKQLVRCYEIVKGLPSLYFGEIKRKKIKEAKS